MCLPYSVQNTTVNVLTVFSPKRNSKCTNYTLHRKTMWSFSKCNIFIFLTIFTEHYQISFMLRYICRVIVCNSCYYMSFMLPYVCRVTVCHLCYRMFFVLSYVILCYRMFVVLSYVFRATICLLCFRKSFVLP